MRRKGSKPRGSNRSSIPQELDYLRPFIESIQPCRSDEDITRLVNEGTNELLQPLFGVASQIRKHRHAERIDAWLDDVDLTMNDVARKLYFFLGLFDALEISIEPRSFSEMEIKRLWQISKLPELPWLAQLTREVLGDAAAADLAMDRLSAMPGKELNHAVVCLYQLQDERVLSWIEKNLPARPNEDWGRVAATCGLDWHRLRRWLNGETSFRLIALDALNSLWRHDSGPLMETPPHFGNCPWPQKIREVVESLTACGNRTRIGKGAGSAIANWDRIIESSNAVG